MYIFQIKKIHMQVILISTSHFFFMQDIKYFLRYGLNKVKNIFIFSNFEKLKSIFDFEISKSWLVDINKIYICFVFQYILLIEIQSFKYLFQNLVCQVTQIRVGKHWPQSQSSRHVRYFLAQNILLKNSNKKSFCSKSLK